MMAHPPNTDVADFFARHVLPRIHAAVPEAETWIVGRDLTRQVRMPIAVPGVVVTGSVPDVRPYIALATVSWCRSLRLRHAPEDSRSVGHAEVCSVDAGRREGLDAEDGMDVLLANDPQTMAERVVEAIRDPALRDRIRAGARAVAARAQDPATLAPR